MRAAAFPDPTEESGQATVLMLGLVAALVAGALVLGGFGQALGAKSRHQRAADLAAMSAGAAMAKAYPRLFEPVVFPNGVPNRHHLSTLQYEALARAAAVRVGGRNGVRVNPADVRFPGDPFAPTRVAVSVRGATSVRMHGGAGGSRAIAVKADATAEVAPPAGGGLDQPANGHGGGYDGPLAYRMGKPMRPETAAAFDRMAAAARREGGLYLSVVSGFRSDAEQARLFAAHPDPHWVAPPGTSLHRYGTELDLGPPGAYAWLERNCGRFGFIKRYAWEPWHFGFGPNPRDRAHPAQYERGSWEPPGGDPVRLRTGMPSFVPPAFHDPIARAALRWNVPENVLAAQLYAESGFNPFATSPAGAQGIAQFMPGTARGYGLANAYDPVAAIDAEAHMMSDLLRRFGKVSLALAAYNAGSGAVERYGGVPPFAETRAYVARILGLLGGSGDLPVSVFEVKLAA
jgi:hypothetical protein